MTGKPPSPAASHVTLTCAPSVTTPETAGVWGLLSPATAGWVAALGTESPRAFTAWTRAVYDVPDLSRVKTVLRLSGVPISTW